MISKKNSPQSAFLGDVSGANGWEHEVIRILAIGTTRALAARFVAGRLLRYDIDVLAKGSARHAMSGLQYNLA